MPELRRIPEIDAAAAAERLAEGALALDVREPEEWVAGHVGAAEHIPLGELASRLEELPRDRAIVAICRSGARSATATELLLHAGFHAQNLQGGMKAWVQADLPLEPEHGYIA